METAKKVKKTELVKNNEKDFVSFFKTQILNTIGLSFVYGLSILAFRYKEISYGFVMGNLSPILTGAFAYILIGSAIKYYQS